MGNKGMSTTTVAPPKYRSVSQRNSYDRCKYAYYLARVLKVWQKPAAWLPMGSAVHAAAEAWEKSGRTMTVAEAQDVFREEYANEVSKYTEVTPNFDWWFASGPYKAEDDLPRRYDLGLEHVERYIEWALAHPDEKVWIAPGYIDPRCESGVDHADDCDCREPQLASELGFEFMAGDVPVRGFIDLVIEVTHPAVVDKRCEKLKANAELVEGMGPEIEHPEWQHIKGKCSCRPIWKELVVRDIKTGSAPGDDFQLGVYGVAIHELFGVDLPEAGDYFMTKSGKPTFAYDISKWTPEKVAEEFRRLEDGIESEDWEPSPAPSKCKFCDVAASCDFRAG